MPGLLRVGRLLLLLVIEAPTCSCKTRRAGTPVAPPSLVRAGPTKSDLGLLVAQISQNLFCRPYSSILCLFENGKAAQIGICEQQWSIECGQLPALVVKDCAGFRSRHCVSEAHDIDS